MRPLFPVLNIYQAVPSALERPVSGAPSSRNRKLAQNPHIHRHFPEVVRQRGPWIDGKVRYRGCVAVKDFKQLERLPPPRQAAAGSGQPEPPSASGVPGPPAQHSYQVASETYAPNRTMHRVRVTVIDAKF